MHNQVNDKEIITEHMDNNKIELRTIKSLENIRFQIPEYQRGYRWKSRQVQDLLEDIHEFMNDHNNGKYCLQPLVVRRCEPKEEDIMQKVKDAKNTSEIKNHLKEQWEVIDGQQRLTTIFIILKYFSIDLFDISYDTRKNSQEFLKNINNYKNIYEYIDFEYMYNTYTVVKEWFKKYPELKDKFLKTILYNTEFIWYECKEDPIEVFTRLNIGKISLTNSELVKALFLNDSNFNDSDSLEKDKIAIMWDRIEYALQKDEFWCFTHEQGYNQPTRIDYLLEIIVKLKNNNQNNNSPGIDFEWYVEPEELGNDSYKTFRYFFQIYKKNKNSFVNSVWIEIVNLYYIINEWYNKNECYHYIGYLFACKEHGSLRDKEFGFEKLITLWNNKKNKEEFINELKSEVGKTIKDVNNLNQQYEIETIVGNSKKTIDKTKCYPLLLLFNIQTIVNKNEQFAKDNKYNSRDFERFPFNLFKKTKWDVEHIASNTNNPMDKKDVRVEWLESLYNVFKDVFKDGNIKTTCEKLLEKYQKDSQFDIDDADFEDVKKYIEDNKLDGNLNNKERNQIWNFCLLDQSTNRSYGNSIFARKRKIILNKEQGLDADGNNLSKQVYILPCTLKVFTKFYTTQPNNLGQWDQTDAKEYKAAIQKTLNDFNVKH